MKRPTTPTEEPPALLDVAAVATLLGGCSTRHVRRLAKKGMMPTPKRLGTLVRWSRSELDAWITNGCQPVVTAKIKKGGAQ
jgi:excisionase family DNA binding protein